MHYDGPVSSSSESRTDLGNARAASRDHVQLWVHLGRIDRLLQALEGATRIRERRFLSDALERAVLWADPRAIHEAQAARLREVGISDAYLRANAHPAPPHAVHVPLVATGVRTGFVRSMYVTHRLDARDEGLAPFLDEKVMRTSLRLALELAAERHPPRHELSAYTVTAAQLEPLARLQLQGASMGAAAFVSAVALFSDRRVKEGTAITGALGRSGLLPVGGVPEKVEAALLSRPDVRRLLVPHRNEQAVRAALANARIAAEVVPVSSLDEVIAHSLEASSAEARDPDDDIYRLRQKFARGWHGYRWPAMIEALERAAERLPPHRPDLALELHTMSAAARRHIGDPEASARAVDEARALLDFMDVIPDAPITRFHQHAALTLRTLGDFEQAEQEAERAIDVAVRGRHQGELLKAHGCAGLVAVAAGKLEEAIAHQEKARDLAKVQRPQSAPRTAGYLVEALGRAGRLSEAEALYHDAQRELAALGDSPRARSMAAWLRMSFASACYFEYARSEAPLFAMHLPRALAETMRDVLDHESVNAALAGQAMPGMLLRRYRGLSLHALGQHENAWDLWATSAVAYGRGLAPQLRSLAHLNVLIELSGRLRHGAVTGDSLARAQQALSELPRYGKLGELLAPLMADLPAYAIQHALSSGRVSALPRDTTAIDALIVRGLSLF